ncbi:MAG: hypothetical protein HDT14_10510 [Oscillibacter sp.]|nr:hypothetical protein [Oscillibacter sp.]
MEINAVNRQNRIEQSIRSETRKKNSSTGGAVSSSAGARTDSLTLSGDIVERLKEQSQRLMALFQQDQPVEKKPSIWDILDGEEKTGDGEAGALGEQIKTMERCHKIAARIMRGDKVPPEDERYLMENDPDGYKLALAMRQPRKHPKKWESVLKDEDKKQDQSQAAESSGEEAVAESGEASGGDTSSSEE